ncbi:MMPL family transporter [soil metagenome]|nr:MMPL family transporter [Gemmatimonadota bacterium]
MDRFVQLVRRRADGIVLLTLLVTALFAGALPFLEIHNPSEKYELPQEDPVARDFRRLQALFGEQEVVILGIAFESVIALAEMQLLDRLTRELEQREGIANVASLANASWIYWHTVPPLIGPLYRPQLEDPSAMDRLVRFATGQPLFAGNLISEDGRSAAVLIEFSTRGLSSEEKTRYERHLVEQVRGVVDAERPHFRSYHLAGLPLIDLAFEENLNADLALFGGLSALLTLGILLLLFRSWQPVVLASGLALVSLVWALGVVSFTGTPLSVGLAMMVPLILVVSIAYSVHYLTFLFRPENRGAPKEEVLERMLRGVLPPSLLTGLTTACGFFALNASRLEGVREVGTHLAIGVLACGYLSSVFLPALLFRLPALNGGRVRMGQLPGELARKLGHWVVGRTGTIIAAALLLSLISALGMLQLRVDSNHLFYFRPDEPVRRDYRFVDENFGGAVPLEILVTRPRAELNEAVEEVRRLSATLRALDGIGSVASVADLVSGPEPTARAAAGFGPLFQPDRLPVPVWERIGASEFGRSYLRLEDTLATLRISVRARVQGTHGLERLLEEVRERVDTHLSNEQVLITGMVPIFVRTLDYIVRSQIYSFTLAFGVILLIISVLTRSWRLGVITMLANTLPVLLVLGAMGWLRIPLDISTVMIASVVIGIAVDDTIHFLYRFLKEKAATPNIEEVVTQTFRQVGTPLVISTLVFFGGFMVLVPSSFVPISYFGLLSGLTVLAALVGDLLLLPALLKALPRYY